MIYRTRLERSVLLRLVLRCCLILIPALRYPTYTFCDLKDAPFESIRVAQLGFNATSPALLGARNKDGAIAFCYGYLKSKVFYS